MSEDLVRYITPSQDHIDSILLRFRVCAQTTSNRTQPLLERLTGTSPARVSADEPLCTLFIRSHLRSIPSCILFSFTSLVRPCKVFDAAVPDEWPSLPQEKLGVGNNQPERVEESGRLTETASAWSVWACFETYMSLLRSR